MFTVENYDPNWPRLFQNEKDEILNLVGQWLEKIEHVGSTAIVGLPAKPTIDICIGVSALEQADKHIIEPLQKRGYEYIQAHEAYIPERRYLQKLNQEGRHLYHIHIVVTNGRLWNDYLRFRDYLAAHPGDAQAYAHLKYKLKAQFPHDRKAYTGGKADFIQEIHRKALIWERNSQLSKE